MCLLLLVDTALEPPNLGLSNAHLVTCFGLMAHDIFSIELTPPPYLPLLEHDSLFSKMRKIKVDEFDIVLSQGHET